MNAILEEPCRLCFAFMCEQIDEQNNFSFPTLVVAPQPVSTAMYLVGPWKIFKCLPAMQIDSQKIPKRQK